MIGFVIGLFIGCWIGFIIAGLMVSASKIDCDGELLGVTEDEEYIQYKKALYKKVSESVKN